MLSDSHKRLESLESISVAASHAGNSNVMTGMKDTDEVAKIYYLEMPNPQVVLAKQPPPGFEFALVAPPDYDLDNDAPLKIGHGINHNLRGAMADLRLYRGALSADDIAKISTGK